MCIGTKVLDKIIAKKTFENFWCVFEMTAQALIFLTSFNHTNARESSKVHRALRHKVLIFQIKLITWKRDWSRLNKH